MLLLLLLLERSELMLTGHSTILVMLLLKMLSSHLLLHVRRSLLSTKVSSHLLAHLRHVMTGMLHELVRRRVHSVHELTVVVSSGNESGVVGVSRHVIGSFSLDLALNSLSVRRVSDHRCSTRSQSTIASRTRQRKNGRRIGRIVSMS